MSRGVETEKTEPMFKMADGAGENVQAKPWISAI